MKKIRQSLRKALVRFENVNRDARYVVALLWAVPLFLLTLLQAVNSGWFDSVETPVFHFFNNWPHWLSGIMYVITQFGSLGGLIAWVALGWYLVNRRAAGTVLLAGVVAWLAAKIAKTGVHRGRPQEFLHQINLFHNHAYSGYGFPSGHSTFSAACVTVLYYQVSPRYRKYLLAAVLLVGISRMYLGAHFPLDVVGGWALGVICGSIVMLLVGTSVKSISAHRIKRVMIRKGYDITSVRFATLDARGSRPVFIEDANGRQYFGKIFGAQEHAADWLFKLYRFFRYKNLQAEEPYINGRRNIEMESFANLWAKKCGLRSPEIVDIIKIGSHWLLVQERVDAKPLPEFKRLQTTTLEDAWRQVLKLHNGNMAHRDLRAANLMVDTSANVWLIDFGFAEVSPNKARKSMDVAELLMSMSLLVGVERTVTAARKVMGKDVLKHALPYVHRSVFSGATNQLLRQNKPLLKDLQAALKEATNVKGEVTPANINRLSRKKLLSIVVIAVFAYVVIPQFTRFKDTLGALDEVRLIWVVPVVLFSLLTYVAAGAVYVALAEVPLRLREATIVQLAASFMSKIVPGGIGATGLNARYLTKSGLDAAEASALILGQNVIGFVMFIVPLLLFTAINGQSLGGLFHLHIKLRYVVLGLAVVVVVGLAITLHKKLRAKTTSFVTTTISRLRDLASSPQEVVMASIASFSITLFYIGCLFAAAHAVSAPISIVAAIVIYASAMIAKAAVPTPGGLGPVEVAMSIALVGAGIPSGQAFAVVILYRIATFWAPVPLSILAYRYVITRNIV